MAGACPYCDSDHGPPEWWGPPWRFAGFMAGYVQGRKEHEAYVRKMEELAELMKTDPGRGTPEGDRLLELAIECEEYEQVNYPIGEPAPPEPAHRSPGAACGVPLALPGGGSVFCGKPAGHPGLHGGGCIGTRAW
jgi:hypothetical protein